MFLWASVSLWLFASDFYSENFGLRNLHLVPFLLLHFYRLLFSLQQQVSMINSEIETSLSGLV